MYVTRLRNGTSSCKLISNPHISTPNLQDSAGTNLQQTATQARSLELLYSRVKCLTIVKNFAWSTMPRTLPRNLLMVRPKASFSHLCYGNASSVNNPCLIVEKRVIEASAFQNAQSGPFSQIQSHILQLKHFLKLGHIGLCIVCMVDLFVYYYSLGFARG